MSTHQRIGGHARRHAVPPDTQTTQATGPILSLALAPLHNALGDVHGEDALVIGPHGIDVMCDLIQGGARSVTLLRTDKRPEAHSASLVVVPEPPSIEWLACVLGHARRALLPAGRLVLRVSALAGRQLVAQITRMLRVHGYIAIVARQSGGQLLLNAQIPAFGRQMLA